MATTAKIEKWKKPPKFKVRGFIRDFELCRVCFRELAWQGKIPGVKKASW